MQADSGLQQSFPCTVTLSDFKIKLFLQSVSVKKKYLLYL